MNITTRSLSLLGLLAIGIPSWAADKKVTFADDVQPIFRNRCANCHNPDNKKSDLDVMSYLGIMTGGASGEVLAAGDAGSSRLYALITHSDTPKMPPAGDKMPDNELAIVKQWIDGGLLETASSKAKASKKPKMDLALGAGPVGKPEGPAAMPQDLILQPVVHSPRPAAVSALATSPWAPVIAVAGQKQIMLYHADSLELTGILPFPEGFAYVLKFSRNGNLLLAGGGIGGKSGKVVVWDVKTGERVTEVGDEFDCVFGADISADQSMIALAGPSKLVKIYSTSTGELLHSIKKHTDWIYTLEFSPDGVLLASGDRSGGLQVWETHTGREFYSLRAHTAAIYDLSWRGDSNILASSSEDTTIRIWEMNNGNQVKSWGAHGAGVESVEFTHDGRIVSTGRDRVTKTWDLEGKQLVAFEAFNDLGLEATFNHDGSKVIAGDWTGEIRVWNSADGKRIGNIDANPKMLSDRYSEAETLLTAAKPKAEQLGKAFAEAQQKATVAAQNLAAAQKALADAQAAMTASQAKLAELDKAVKAQTAQLAEQQKALAAHEPTVKPAQDGLAAAQTAYDQAVAALGAAQVTHTQQQQAATNADQALKTAQEAASKKADDKALQEAAQKAQEAQTTAATQLQAAAADVEQKTAAVKSTSETYGKTKVASDQAVAALTALQTQIAQLTAAIAKGQEAIKAETPIFEKAKVAVDVATKGVPVAEEAAKTSAAAAEQAKPPADQAAAELAAAQRKVDQLVAAQANLDLHDARKAHQSLVDEQQLLTDAATASKAALDKYTAELAAKEKFVVDGPELEKAEQAKVAAAQKLFETAQQTQQASQLVVQEKQAVAAAVAETLAKVQALSAKEKDNAGLALAAAKCKESQDALAGDIAAAQKVVETRTAESLAAKTAWDATQQALAKLQADLKQAPEAIVMLKQEATKAGAKAEEDKLIVEAIGEEIVAAKATVDQLTNQYAELSAKMK